MMLCIADHWRCEWFSLRISGLFHHSLCLQSTWSKVSFVENKFPTWIFRATPDPYGNLCTLEKGAPFPSNFFLSWYIIYFPIITPPLGLQVAYLVKDKAALKHTSVRHCSTHFVLASTTWTLSLSPLHLMAELHGMRIPQSNQPCQPSWVPEVLAGEWLPAAPRWVCAETGMPNG